MRKTRVSGLYGEKLQPVQTNQETVVTTGCKMMSYREAQEHGEVLRWSSVSEGDTEKSDGTGKEIRSFPFEGLIVPPETELQDSPAKAGKETTVTETCLGMKVAKQFEGEITAVNTKRGRSLYTVLDEDGDGEDFNDKEFKEARALFLKKDEATNKHVERVEYETEEIPLHSGGETEESDFIPSDDEMEHNRKKTILKELHTPGKEKENKIGRKSIKEAKKKAGVQNNL